MFDFLVRNLKMNSYRHFQKLACYLTIRALSILVCIFIPYLSVLCLFYFTLEIYKTPKKSYTLQWKNHFQIYNGQKQRTKLQFDEKQTVRKSLIIKK